MIDESTLTLEDISGRQAAGRTVTATGLTVIGHPDPERIGDRVCFSSAETAVSRNVGAFASPDGRVTGPLADRFVSRTPVVFAESAAGVVIRGRAIVGGIPISGPHAISRQQLASGVTVELGRRVALLLHEVPILPRTGERYGLVGDSPGIVQLLSEITRAGESTAPVLIRGETGAGKELVAQAVHAASDRAGGPYQAVNVAAVPATVAASAFFGHVRGAFSGADKAQPGYFGDSDGGTLFLDEIGDLPRELQPMLLRALESGEIQPVGARRARKVDARIIAATDARLEEAIEAGRFSRALLYRLTGVEIRVPPLRERRDDIGRLLVFGLRRELARSKPAAAAKPSGGDEWWWLDAGIMAALTRYDWPGNVRELMNVARQIVLAVRSSSPVHARDVPVVARIISAGRGMARPSPDSVPPPSHSSGRSARERRSHPTPPPEFSPQVVLDALLAARWSVPGAARHLGVAKSTLYRYLDRTRLVRKAEEIPEAEIRAAWVECRGDRRAMCDQLRISARSLTHRLNRLDPPVEPIAPTGE